MPNPTVRANLKLIEELQKNQTEIGERVLELTNQLQNELALTANTLATVIEFMMREGLIQDMKTHRGRWLKVVDELKEVGQDEDSDTG